MQFSVKNVEDFKEWVRNYGDNFRYDQSPGQEGDVFIFAWAEEVPWLAVGDAIVVSRYRKKGETLAYHTVTGAVRVYPKHVILLKKPKRGERILRLKNREYGEIIKDAYA